MTLTITLDEELPDGRTTFEHRYEVEMLLVGFDWWLDSIKPTPPNEYIEERIVEMAVTMLEAATHRALDSEGT